MWARMCFEGTIVGYLGRRLGYRGSLFDGKKRCGGFIHLHLHPLDSALARCTSGVRIRVWLRG